MCVSDWQLFSRSLARRSCDERVVLDGKWLFNSNQIHLVAALRHGPLNCGLREKKEKVLNRNEDWKRERFPFCSIRHSGHERAVQLGHIYIIKDRVEEAIFCSDMYISALHYYAQLNNQVSSFFGFSFLYVSLCW